LSVIAAAKKDVTLLLSVDRGASAVKGREFSVVAGKSSFHFVDQTIHVHQEAGTAGMWAFRDDFGRALGKAFLPGKACPTPDIAIGNRCKAAQVIDPACIPKFPEKVFEAEPKVLRKLRHVAAQHDPPF